MVLNFRSSVKIYKNFWSSTKKEIRSSAKINKKFQSCGSI